MNTRYTAISGYYNMRGVLVVVFKIDNVFLDLFAKHVDRQTYMAKTKAQKWTTFLVEFNPNSLFS